MRASGAVAVLFLIVAGAAELGAQQPADTAYTRQIRELTSDARFNTELTDHLPDDPRVPTPLDVLGYVPGTVGRLSRVADVNRYFRALAAATPRVRVFDVGRSDEGRQMITVAVADSATLASLEDYRRITARLADPRGLADADARALVARGKPIYHLTGAIHSPETGSPEMLMELAYRLAVQETDLVRGIRERVITLITPVVEVDGRDRMVDVYEYGRAHGVRPPLVYWGRYTAHDNNRDGMVVSQLLTRHMLDHYLHWHPTVLHDLHESVPFLYTSTGTGPYNRAIDPVQVSEWNALAHFEISELTKRGVPGVWTHGFYDGWAPNYMMFIAQLRNSVGRFYETYTSFGAECDTSRVSRNQTTVEWFRTNPPLDGVRWCIRNNINYQQSGVLLALHYVAERGTTFLENFWLKSRRAVERGRSGSVNLWHVPADQPRRNATAEMVNLLRLQGIEVHRADQAFTAAGVSVAAGDYLVRMDQPYGPLAGELLGIQAYRPSDPNPYDDTGWTFGPLRNVAVHPIGDSASLSRPMTLLTADVRVRGSVDDAGGRGVLLIPATTETNLVAFRFLLRDVVMFAAEDSFSVSGRTFAPGTTMVPVGDRETDRRVRSAIDSLGITAVGVRNVPAVARHELDVPRVGLVHTWISTQDEGWVRYAFDRIGVPYTYLSTQELRDSALLSRLDVLVLPHVGGRDPFSGGASPLSLVAGQAMAGPPIPWRRSPQTPSLGRYDETDDVRPGIGLAGLARLEEWVSAGGVLITEGATAALPIQFGLAGGGLTPGGFGGPGISLELVAPRQLRVRGTVVRATRLDARSPIAYGYADTIGVYFNRGPLIEPDTQTARGTELPRDSATMEGLRRLRPRVVVGFHRRADSLLVSGLLDGGGELAGRAAVIDAPLGAGHVIMFAIRPWWRWETQGSFGLGFNAILHWNDLSVGWPPASAAAARGR